MPTRSMRPRDWLWSNFLILDRPASARIYVHEQQEKTFLEELSSRVSKLKAGPGINKDSKIGPLINEEALEKVDQQVRDAI